ncbi:MAG TPA: PIG-L family deacetylase, partial [Candidatus Saccharimonadales bacterium]|nr:PIG-L family deacetylase [Candidatus Saccharimonadales bacterium]
MKSIHELLVDHRVGVISAHPDDHLVQGNGIQAAHAAGAIVRELTIAKGRASTLNYLPDPHFVANGYREYEGRSAAHYMGITSNDHLDGTDGNLAAEQAEHVPVVAEWIAYHGIDLLMTLGGVADHPDHIASAAIAKQAAMQLWNDDYPVGILEVQQRGSAPWKARASSKNQATIFGAAALHPSQMLISPEEQPGWDQVP